MSDWADEVANQLTNSYWDGCMGDEISVSRSELAAALRRAKKSGMEEAANLGDALADDAPDGGIVDNGGLRVGWQSACVVYQEKIRQLRDTQP